VPNSSLSFFRCFFLSPNPLLEHSLIAALLAHKEKNERKNERHERERGERRKGENKSFILFSMGH